MSSFTINHQGFPFFRNGLNFTFFEPVVKSVGVMTGAEIDKGSLKIRILQKNFVYLKNIKMHPKENFSWKIY